MKDKVIIVVWSASLFLISISTVVTAGANLLGLTLPLPDLAVRVFGGIQLLSVAALGWSSAKQFLGKAKVMEEKMK